MDDNLTDQRLSLMQDSRVFVLGKMLRSSFAVDHESLGSDVTGLMIDLSKLPDKPSTVEPHPRAAETPQRSRHTPWLALAALLFGRR